MNSCTLLLLALASFDNQAGRPLPVEEMASAATRVLDAARAADEDARLLAKAEADGITPTFEA